MCCGQRNRVRHGIVEVGLSGNLQRCSSALASLAGRVLFLEALQTRQAGALGSAGSAGRQIIK
jgi:hypothetical protein